MLDFKIWPALPNEKSDMAKTRNFACLIFNVNIVYNNSLMSTEVPEEAEMTLISLGEKDLLGEKE